MEKMVWVKPELNELDISDTLSGTVYGPPESVFVGNDGGPNGPPLYGSGTTS